MKISWSASTIPHAKSRKRFVSVIAVVWPHTVIVVVACLPCGQAVTDAQFEAAMSSMEIENYLLDQKMSLEVRCLVTIILSDELSVTAVDGYSCTSTAR